MDENLKKQVDSIISKLGIKKVKDNMLKALNSSEESKKRILKAGGNLKNIPSHIKAGNEIIEYLDDLLKKERDDKINMLLSEKRIIKFKEFINFYEF